MVGFGNNNSGSGGGGGDVTTAQLNTEILARIAADAAIQAELDGNWIDTTDGLQLEKGKKYIIQDGHNVLMPVTPTNGDQVMIAPGTKDWITLNASTALTAAGVTTVSDGQSELGQGSDVGVWVYDSVMDNWTVFVGARAQGTTGGITTINTDESLQGDGDATPLAVQLSPKPGNILSTETGVGEEGLFAEAAPTDWIDTVDGQTLEEGAKYNLIFGHSVVFPVPSADGKEIRIVPVDGDWAAETGDFTTPGAGEVGPGQMGLGSGPDESVFVSDGLNWRVHVGTSGSGSSNVGAINDLTDVDTTGAVEGSLLTFDSSLNIVPINLSNTVSSRVGEFFFAKSGSTVTGYLPVTPGTVANGATLYPTWAAMYPEFITGSDIVFPADVEGIFLRNLGGNAATEATFQDDATAPNGLDVDTQDLGVSANSSHPFEAAGTGNTGGASDVPFTITSSDPETRPINYALQLYTIVDSYNEVTLASQVTPQPLQKVRFTQKHSDGSLTAPSTRGDISLTNTEYANNVTSSDASTCSFVAASNGLFRVHVYSSHQDSDDDFKFFVSVDGVDVAGHTFQGNGSNVEDDSFWLSGQFNVIAGQEVKVQWEGINTGGDATGADAGQVGDILAIEFEQQTESTVVAADQVPVEGERVLLGSATGLASNQTVTISDTWGNLAATYEKVEIELIGTAGTLNIRQTEILTTASWTDGVRAVFVSDNSNQIVIRNMDIAGSTANLFLSGSAVTTANINVYGVKPQQTVINTTDTPVNDQSASGYIDIGTQRMQWGIGNTGSGPTESLTTLPVPFLDNSYIVTATPSDFNGQVTNLGATKTTTQFGTEGYDVNGGNNAHQFNWIAIGLKP